MVRDNTGRFGQRPHYALDELDRECEALILSFLRRHHGDEHFPVATDDLHVLIEEFAEDLDAYADLSDYGDDVEGVTAFFPDRRPSVSISEKLANDPRRENRLRTTLTHEFGHVYFHRHLWDEKFFAGRLFGPTAPENKTICKRDTILGAGQYDWMEWQAGYVSGAMLMPVRPVRRLVGDYREEHELLSSIQVHSEHAREILQQVMERFAVSEDAARVRLLKLNALTEFSPEASLFD
ncbi:MAG: ImmA/IrrE family metallo-endopeptidase [Magnetococcales bacterium]|nr:ImmA/IrrE family metallo-endopeptidase [Magnetococcales bacterium]